MKKNFVLAAAFAMLFCFSACGKDAAPDGYERLNEMLNAQYSRIELSVEDEIDSDTVLHSEYTLLFGETVSVYYSVERLAEIGSPDEILPAAKTVLAGEAKIENGKLEFVKGDDAGIKYSDLGGSLSFKAEYFESAELGSTYLKADVIDPDSFWGGEPNCSDMKVSAIFPDKLSELSITYRSEGGSNVKIKYTFII